MNDQLALVFHLFVMFNGYMHLDVGVNVETGCGAYLQGVLMHISSGDTLIKHFSSLFLLRNRLFPTSREHALLT